MKKFVTIVLLLLSANLVYAQDVVTSREDATTGLTVYQDPDRSLKIWARMDSGVMSIDHVGTANKSAVVWLNGGEKTSILGFKFNENLENGWTTGIRLDAQVMPSDGSVGNSAATGTAGNIWAQYAYWYLNNPIYGKLTVGRADAVAYTINKMSDARPGYNFGSALTFWTDNSAFGGSATTKTGFQSITGGNQVNSEIRYDSPTVAGAAVAFGWQPGNTAGGLDLGEKGAWNATYKPSEGLLEGLSVGVGQNYINSSAGKLVGRTTIVGGNYVFDDKRANIAAGYVKMENPSLDKTATFASYDMWEASAKYFITPKWDVNGGWYDLKDNNVHANGATQYAVGTQYYLTKRIMAYLDWARVDNKGNLGFAPYGPSTGSYNSLSTYYPQATVKVPGQKETAVLIGIQIEF